MNILKSLIFGSSTALIAVSGAQAADLPVKAKAIEYVKVCSIYGAGFYYIPGTDTCIKLGGYMRVDVNTNANGDFNGPNWAGNAGQGNRLRNEIITRARQAVDLDTRTATEYGILRTFMRAKFTWTNSSDVVAGGTLATDYAYIQFAGFTMGKAQSPFEAPWSNYPGNLTDYLVGGPGTVTGVNQLTYTAQFGSGVSATVSAQEQTGYLQTPIYNTSGATAAGIPTGVFGTNNTGGETAPDFIGQFQVDQAWGLFQTAIAAHDNHATYYGATSDTGHPNDVWGFAGEMSLSIKNVPTGAGDTINVDAAYAKGASRYVFNSLIPTSFAMYGNGSGGLAGSVAFAGLSDSVYGGTTAATGTALALTTSYGFRGAYTHNWNPHWASALFGGWAAEKYSATGRTLMCSATLTALLTVGSTCNPDFSLGQIGFNTSWTPVVGLTFTGEAMYTKLHQNDTGSITLPAIATNPAGTYAFKDQNTVTVSFRAQRNF